MQLAGLLVYFAAALAFVDSPKRLKLVARLVIIFGFVLAVYGLMQHFVNPRTIFWVREPKQAEPFGPYINRHHFAGYMELALAMPLGYAASDPWQFTEEGSYTIYEVQAEAAEPVGTAPAFTG